MNHQPYHEDIKALLQLKIHQLTLLIFDHYKIELIEFGSH